MWIFLLCNCLLIPVIVWGSAKLFAKFPASRNALYGYRTKSSMQSDEAWLYAQEQWMQTWDKLGKWLLLPALGLLFCLGQNEDFTGICATVIVIAQLLLMLGSLPYIERKIRRKFPK